MTDLPTGGSSRSASRPAKIVCVGLNYRDHAEEQGLDLPPRPLLFAKWPTAVIGPGEPIVLPSVTAEVDYEAELGVVIGEPARAVPAERAHDVVAGHVCVNDVTARDLQFSDGQWTRAKSFDTFCPVGPEVVPAAQVGDPQDLGSGASSTGSRSRTRQRATWSSEWPRSSPSSARRSRWSLET